MQLNGHHLSCEFSLHLTLIHMEINIRTKPDEIYEIF